MYKVNRIFLGLFLFTFSCVAKADGGLGAIEGLYALAAFLLGAPVLVAGILILFFNSKDIVRAKNAAETSSILIRRSIILIVTSLLMIAVGVLMLNYAFSV